MVAPSKLVGANAIVQVGGVTIGVADFTVNIKRGAVLQSRVGKWSDRKLPGKLEVQGSLTNLDILGDHIGRLLNSGAAVAPETITVIESCDALTNWVSSDPTNTPITLEGTIKKEGTNSLKIAASGPLSLNDTITATVAAKNLSGHHFLGFWLYSTLAGAAVVKIGMGEAGIAEQEHAITIQQASTWQFEYWDISQILNASKDAITKIGITVLTSTACSIYVDAINSYKGVQVGPGAVINISGDANDGAGAYVKVTCSNCIVTSGVLKIGDASKIIDGPLEFSVSDADVDLVLNYT
uniref:Uncharacterized protein n=1 Tax=viral metagenome TaxID=1070528 RepID=A0A6M3M1H5_9ZZZZ